MFDSGHRRQLYEGWLLITTVRERRLSLYRRDKGLYVGRSINSGRERGLSLNRSDEGLSVGRLSVEGFRSVIVCCLLITAARRVVVFL